MAQKPVTRRDFLKTIGAALVGGVVAGCVPAAPPTLEEPTLTASPTRTNSPTLAPTQLDTATPTSTQSPEATETPQTTQEAAPYQDVLTLEQKARLNQAALRYVAATEAEAIRVAKALAYVQGDGHPASMCGPLSVAILRDAGLLNAYIDLHEFWLLNPRDQQPVLEKVFPPDRFEWHRITESTRSFNFSTFPLKAGDFLYLFAGDAGSFEHMLTVSRVDEQGRAYSVTNYETETGFYIGERMLYDPSDPGAGQFYTWTDRKYAQIGMTGFGGFWVLRFATPVRDPEPQEVELARQIDLALAEAGGDWKILIKELEGPEIYARRSLDRVHVASVIKLTIAVLFLKSVEDLGITDLRTFLKTGTADRSYQQLLRAMLVDSEEDAAAVLEGEISANRLHVPNTLAAWGLPGIDLRARRATVQELVRLAELLYLGRLLPPEGTQILLELLETYTPNDDTRLGILRQRLPPGYHFYNKRGTITDGLMVVGDLAIVSLPTPAGDRVFTLGIFAYQSQQPTTYERLDAAMPKVAQAFWEYTQSVGQAIFSWRRSKWSGAG